MEFCCLYCADADTVMIPPVIANVGPKITMKNLIIVFALYISVIFQVIYKSYYSYIASQSQKANFKGNPLPIFSTYMTRLLQIF